MYLLMPQYIMKQTLCGKPDAQNAPNVPVPGAPAPALCIPADYDYLSLHMSDL
jgi:hypothetical protein